jgi:uncharacterized membrane-anchored protein
VKNEITKALGDGTVLVAVSGGIVNKLGWFEFINANAPGLGFIASCFFGLIATFFYYITYKAKNDNTIKIAELENALAKIDDRKINKGK